MKDKSVYANPMIFAAFCFIPGVTLGLSGASGDTLAPVVYSILIVTLVCGMYFGQTGIKQRSTLHRAYVTTVLIGISLFCAGFIAGIRGKVCPSGTGWSFALQCRERLCACIDSTDFGDTCSAPMLKALLLGDRSGLERGTIEIFRKSGASHLLALSGLHMGILCMLIDKMLSPIGNTPVAKIIRSGILLSLSLFFVLMTGASPSIVRAFLFILIHEVGTLTHRKQSLLHCLCTAIVIQCTIIPDSPSSKGFILSYLAVLGICLFNPFLSGLYPASKGPLKKVWDLGALSISCQIGAAPAAWLYFGSFPAYFLITNLLSIPIMNLLMLSGLVTLALGALGHCPEMVVKATGLCCRTLLRVLETIAAL